jgi:hypothetical protein
MPRRAQPGHRDAIEASLTPAMRAALDELRALLNVWDWQCSPLCAPFTQAAILLRAAQLVEAGECSEKDAIDRAAIMLGCSSDTARSRARRWPRDSRSLCTPTTQQPAGKLKVQLERRMA